MIEVVTSRNALLYRDALEDACRFRNELPVLALIGPKDTDLIGSDGFDTADALHLLLTRDDGVVIAALRLLPTTGPHLFSDVMPQLCDVRGVQRGEKILELTRSCVDEEALDKAALETARNRLLVGLFEFCLRAGFEKFTLLMATDMLFRYLLIGLDIKPLGTPVDSDGNRQVAVIVTVDRESLDALRTALQVPETQVDYVGAPAGDPLILAPFDAPPPGVTAQ